MNKKNNKKTLLLLCILLLAVLIKVYVIDDNPSEVVEQPPQQDEQKPQETAHDFTQTPPPVVANEFTNSKLEVYFFDVGQADSILLRTDNKVMLIDTGNSGDADTSFKIQNKINLSHELNRLGITTIDYLVLTHPHEDHMGSAYKILKMFDVKELYANKLLPEEEWTAYYRRFVSALEESNTHLVTPTTLTNEELQQKVDDYNKTVSSEDEKVVFNPADYFRVGDTIPFGNAKVTILAPSSQTYSDTNDYSIVLLVEFEGVKLIFTGDAGKLAEQEIISYCFTNNINLKADILKVGHHGSRTANTKTFIEAVHPKYAIIMVGQGNSYGLPDEDVIERLEQNGATIYQTMDVGDIKLVVDNGQYEFDLNFQHEEKAK